MGMGRWWDVRCLEELQAPADVGALYMRWLGSLVKKKLNVRDVI